METETLPATQTPEEADAAREKARDEAMVAAGEPLHDNQPVDYFDFDDVERVFLPDGVQWFEIKALNEGERKRYLNQTNNEVKVHRGSGDAAFKTRPGDDKHLLLTMSITNFHVLRGNQPFSFTPQHLLDVLDKFPPKVIDVVEKAVRTKNPWLMAEMSLEDMVKERDNLNDMIDVKTKEEAGKGV